MGKTFVEFDCIFGFSEQYELTWKVETLPNTPFSYSYTIVVNRKGEE